MIDLELYCLTEEDWEEMPMIDKFNYEVDYCLNPAEDSINNAIRFVESYYKLYGCSDNEKDRIIANLNKAWDILTNL